jgi:hypothetical protein
VASALTIPVNKELKIRRDIQNKKELRIIIVFQYQALQQITILLGGYYMTLL